MSSSELSSHGLSRWWTAFWFDDDYDYRNIGLIRIWVGFSMVIFNFSQFTNLLGVEINGPQFYYIEQLWYFKLLGITHTYPVSNYIFFTLLQLATIALMVGWRSRWAIAVMVICIFYLKGVRDSAAGDDHHRYLMWMNILFILFMSTAHKILAIDHRKTQIKIENWQAFWMVRLMQVSTCLFYFVSALAKFRVSGLNWIVDGSAVQRVLLMKSGRWNFETLPLGQWMAEYPTLCWLAVIFTMTLELTFPFFALQKNVKLRAFFFLGVSFFHIINKIMASVGFWAMPLLFLIFFDLNKICQQVPVLRKRLVAN